MKIVPCNPSHVHELSGSPWPHASEILRDHGIAVYKDGKLLGCGGIFPLWDNVAEAWVMLDPKVKRDPHLGFIASWVAKRYLRDHGEYTRLQADVHRDLPENSDWAEWMGFSFESAMPKYGPEGGTYIRYVRFH